MPELPEVETVKRGLHSLIGAKILKVHVYNKSLRYPIIDNLANFIENCTIVNITRRGKYLLVELSEQNALIIHLGMSGKITLTNNLNQPLIKHDHVEIVFANSRLIYNDPRRFGAIVYTNISPITDHPLFSNLGLEPLTKDFDTQYLFTKLQCKNFSIKQAVMDNQIVVGVGNIYACESLFRAKISPLRTSKNITKAEASKLVKIIKEILKQAIELGGSSLRDYKKADATLGYFQNIHQVYGKNGLPCPICKQQIVSKRIAGRNTFFCTNCQK